MMLKRCLVALSVVTGGVVFAVPVEVPLGATVKISDHTLATDFNLSGGTLEFDIASGGKAEYTGTVTGSGTIEKTGDGWLTFNGGETLTADSTLKASGGRFRFRDAAAAGGAAFVGNGGFFGNVVGTAIVIPASTEVTGSPLRFYAEGVGTNVVVKNCSRMKGQVAVFGDSLASIVKFDGQVPMDSETTYHYVAARTGTALLASELNGFDYFQTIYMAGLGGLMLQGGGGGILSVQPDRRRHHDPAGAAGRGGRLGADQVAPSA